MPLSDLFKKQPKKDEATKAANPFGTPEMQKKRYDAAKEFLKGFQERMPLLRGRPHAGTVLSVAARLAGTSLFRHLNKKDFAPGVIILSEEVNQAYPELLNLFAFYCRENGIDVKAKPLVHEFPAKDKPLMDVGQVLAEYQDEYHKIMQKHGLDYLDGARAGMILCSTVFQYHCTANDIDPYVGTGIVAMGVVEGAKTAPPSPGSVKPSPAGTAIPSTASRFVLGERDAAIQDALDNGGAFIDINPGVLEMLRGRGVDPYIVHEEALKKQIGEKVARIDFVKVDVDELYNTWKPNSLASAPEYVRLIFWLKDHAQTFGYEQSGNSWVLKH